MTTINNYNGEIIEMGVQTLHVDMATTWVETAQSQLDGYVVSSALPQIDTFVQEEINKIQTLKGATTNTAGVVKIATAQDMQEGIENSAVVTPKLLKETCVDNALFDGYQADVETQIASKANEESVIELEAQVTTLEGTINGLVTQIDAINDVSA